MQNNNSKLKIIFIGTSEFGAIILEELCKSKHKPILVVTVPDKPVSRKQILTPSPVKLMAQKYNIPIEQPERIENCKLKIENLKPGLIVVAAYGEIIPKEILEIPKNGSLNVHPSLLPKYRGPAPIQYAILNGDKETGVTIILVDKKMDHGPILAQRELEIRNPKSEIFTPTPKFGVGASKSQIPNFKITYSELLIKLAKLGAELLVETIPKWIKGEIKPKPQDESEATYTKILKKEDGMIDWQKSAEEIERQIRAFDVWPGNYTFWRLLKGMVLRIKILKARVFISPSPETYHIGKVLVVPQNEIGVQCGKDFLVIEKLQMEGGKVMGAEEFLRGHLDFIGTILK